MRQIIIAAGAVVPFLIYLLLGRVAGMIGAADESFLQRLNKISFQFFFPFLIFSNVCRIDLRSGMNMGYIYLAMGISLVALVTAWIIVPHLVHDRPRAVVIIQAIYRGNAVLFVIPLAENFFGASGAQTASLLAGIMVPFYNMVAVILLESFRGGKVSFVNLGKRILTNPLIIAALLGLCLAAFRIAVPELLQKPISTIASTAVPVSLFSLGGMIRLDSLKKNMRVLLPVSFIRLFAVPALALPFLLLPGLTKEQWFCVFMVLCVPIATSSFAMAASMGGDSDLAGEFVTVTSVLSPLALFFWLLVIQYAGVLS